MIFPHELLEQRENAKNEKIAFIQNYINLGIELENSEDVSKINDYCQTCVGLFASEINDFMVNIDIDQYSDYDNRYIKLIVQKLKKYQIDLKMGIYDQKDSNSQNITVTASASNETNIQISISSTISNIMQIPEDKLSQDDKLELIRMLTEIEKSKKEKNIWEKIKKAIKWTVEKGAEVALSTIPYLLGILK